jgi:hypothetical protein
MHYPRNGRVNAWWALQAHRGGSHETRRIPPRPPINLGGFIEGDCSNRGKISDPSPFEMASSPLSFSTEEMT